MCQFHIRHDASGILSSDIRKPCAFLSVFGFLFAVSRSYCVVTGEPKVDNMRDRKGAGTGECGKRINFIQFVSFPEMYKHITRRWWRPRRRRR